MGQLQQLNLSFDPVEDRMLMRVTSSEGEEVLEYRVWLTRRMIRLLWQALEKHLRQDPEIKLKVPVAGREAVMAFQQEEALSQSNFSQPYKPGAAKSVLGDKPVLASRIQIRKTGPEGHQLSLVNEENMGVHLGLNTRFIHSIRKLMCDVTKAAHWDLGLEMRSPTTRPDSGFNAPVN